jgi:hypothetical protein
MVEHLVLVRWKENTPAGSVTEAFEAFRALKDRIPGILELTCGENFSDRAKGFHAGLYVRFRDRAALEAYLPHPEHLRVVQEIINPIREDGIIVDYDLHEN